MFKFEKFMWNKTLIVLYENQRIGDKVFFYFEKKSIFGNKTSFQNLKNK